ncbi:acyltransferase [Chryseobacterium sp. sg2396]|uniref:acyltransferase n=1 Tax=Chryseobacterium sp. sg2396 TaxID=3276280 RepID=UPI00366F39C6
MIILKVLFKINCFFKLLFLKLVYGRKLSYGKKFTFRKHFSLIIDGQNAQVNIGNNVFFNNFCTIAAMDNITIGDNTIFGENVKIYDHNHQFKNASIPIKNQGYSSERIIIGENCWIASNVVILKGVTIGNHSVVGAGNIVYKDVPENSVLLSVQEHILKSSVQ